MKAWIRDNAVGIVFGIVGIASILSAFFTNLVAVASTDPGTFAIWCIGIFTIAVFLGWLLRSFWFRQEMKEIRSLRIDNANLGERNVQMREQVADLKAYTHALENWTPGQFPSMALQKDIDDLKEKAESHRIALDDLEARSLKIADIQVRDETLFLGGVGVADCIASDEETDGNE